MLLSALFRKNIRKLSDEELLEHISNGNKVATGELFKRYATLVMGVCMKYMKNQVLAEDIMMQTFEALPSKIKATEISYFKSWLFTVTRNNCLMELRKRKLPTGDIEKSLATTIDESESVLEESLAKEEKIKALEAAIIELSKEQQQAVTLFYIKQKSYLDISETMGISLKKVKSLIQNGKRNLKLKLAQQV